MSKKHTPKTVRCDLAPSEVHTAGVPVTPQVQPPANSDPDREARRAAYGYFVSDSVLDFEAKVRAHCVAEFNRTQPNVPAATAQQMGYLRRQYPGELDMQQVMPELVRKLFPPGGTWR